MFGILGLYNFDLISNSTTNAKTTSHVYRCVEDTLRASQISQRVSELVLDVCTHVYIYIYVYMYIYIYREREIVTYVIRVGLQHKTIRCGG